ncbi:MAG TPA: acyl-CoA dehydrogenase family protein [Acidimicrobiales bacterium]
MDLSHSADQLALQEAVGRLYAKESHPERVRAAEATHGHDPALWDALTQMGVPTMGVPEGRGGGGARLADLAVVAEQHGAHLGSAPLVETMVVARLLAAAGAPGEAALARLLDGAPAALALRPVAPGTTVAPLVPGGAVAPVVVARQGDELVVALDPAATPKATLHDGPVGDVDLDTAGERAVLATGRDAAGRFEQALDEWRALTAVALAGLARAALDIGVGYVKERHQFGVPIGSFQTIQHTLADAHTATDGARLLAYEAVWAAERGEANAAALAAQAFWFAGETAERASAASLHFHGGYGFMLEYDIQLHARRAKGWRLLLGDPRYELRTIARRRWLTPPADTPAGSPAAPEGTAGAGRPGDDEDGREGAPTVAEEGMDFALDPASEQLRREVRAFLAEHLTDDIVERALDTGTMHDWGLHRKLCERGYLAAGWPKEVGGLGHSAVATTTLMQELYRAGAPIDAMNMAAMVGATLLLRGTEEQRREILPRILAGEVLCALGYSEPDAGSDVAAAQTRAVRDGDQWIVNGQKMFTTMAHEAEYVFLLTRTNPDAPKHKGLTMFLVPMSLPGIEVTPVATVGGERTNITFYTDVAVPDSCRVGDVDDGWSVMHAALVYERASANWGEPAQLVELAAQWAATSSPDGTRPFDDPVNQERLARWDTELEVGRLLLYRSAWMAASGALPLVEGSMAKLALTEAFVRASSDILDMIGPHALLPRGEATTVRGGHFEHAYRHAMVTTIYGGSSEVQREIIAQRGLGLPRSR